MTTQGKLKLLGKLSFGSRRQQLGKHVVHARPRLPLTAEAIQRAVQNQEKPDQAPPDFQKLQEELEECYRREHQQ